MKIYVVTDWSAKKNEAFVKDDEAIDKFRDFTIMAEDHDTISLDEFDIELGERTTLLRLSGGKITSSDSSLSGIAADMDDERHAMSDLHDGD
jgi:hypothetical protein